MIKKYKIIIAYDGTNYQGWQTQTATCKTVAHVLQAAFETVFGRTIKLIGASRTDSGVHAMGQVAVFTTDFAITPELLMYAWNNELPADILIRALHEVPLDFNPRYPVTQKTYYYHFFITRPLPFAARYGYYFYRPIDMQKLKDALAIFAGTHDFRSFCSGYDMTDTVRTIDSIKLVYLRRYNAYRIVVQGPGFLRYMIRRIVGACLEVASREKLSLDVLRTALEEKHPEQTLPNAPAHGLVLYKIDY